MCTRNRCALFLFLLSCFGLSACNSISDLEGLRGRYQGHLILSGISGAEKKQVVAQLPSLHKETDHQRLEFRVFETSVHSKGLLISLELKENQFYFHLPEILSPQNQTFTASPTKDGCAEGIGTVWVRMCLNSGEIRLELITGASEKLFELYLVRGDQLPPVNGYSQPAKEYTLDELLGRAKFLNYTVAQEAERIFQSKHAVQVAQGNLLPSINLKAIVGVFTGDFLELAGKILPFLFPSNWYRWEAQKNIYQAEKLSYAALRGNEMNAVEGLFYSILRDQQVLSTLKHHLTWMENIQNNLRFEEKAGTMPSGSADFFSISTSQLEKDLAGFERNYELAIQALSQGVALSPLNGISAIRPIDLPDLERTLPLRGDDFFRNAQTQSYELKTLQYLLEAAKHETGEIRFAFLSPDGSGSLGFGTASSIQIGKSRERELTVKKDETFSLIEQRAGQIAAEHNAALKAYKIAKRGLENSQKKMHWLITRHLSSDATLSETEFLNTLIEISNLLIVFSADQASSIAAYNIAKSKLDRLLLQGYYENLDVAIPEEVVQ